MDEDANTANGLQPSQINQPSAPLTGGKATRQRTSERFNRRTFTTIGAIAALTATLASCTDKISFGSPTADATAPTPEAAAKEFATALSAGDVSKIAIRGAAPSQVNTQVKEAISDLKGIKPIVTYLSLKPPVDQKCEVTYSVQWDFASLLPPEAAGTKSPTTWKYNIVVPFTFTTGGWGPIWDISLLQAGLNGRNKFTFAIDRPERASILGGNDLPLVLKRKVFQVGIDKTKAPTQVQDAAAKALATLVKIDPVAFASRVAQAGPKQFVIAITLREDAMGPVLAALANIPGAIAPSKELNLAPTSDFAAPILGRVAEATAEMIDKSNGTLKSGDFTGVSGLQSKFNASLVGLPGVRIILDNNPTATAFSTPSASSTGGVVTMPINKPEDVHVIAPTVGMPIKTTLNEKLQILSEQLLAGFTATPSAIVAIQPSTGAVLAAASGPGSNGYSTATLGQYAPGSTFKVATTLAVLRKGQTLQSRVDCPATVVVDGRVFKNDDGFPAAALGSQPLLNVIKYSCNTGFVNLRAVAAQSDLAVAARSLGFEQTNLTGISAYFGDVPDQAQGTLHAASMFGQGQILASPLTMATVAASVLAGRRVTPKFLRETAPDATSASPSAGAPDTAPLNGPEVAALRTAMEAVVQGGTASILSKIPAPAVGAKTGTAQYGAENPPRVHAWMIAYHGDFAACVFVEDGDYGSTTSGPVMEKLLQQAPALLAATPKAPAGAPTASSSTAKPDTTPAPSTKTT